MQIQKKKIAGDIILNFMSALIPIVVLQFVVYPIVAQKTSDGSYGLMITIYSLLRIVAFSLGNVVNNVRLVNLSKYKDADLAGDFNLLLFFFCIIDVIIIGVGTVYYEVEVNLKSISLITFTSIFLLLDEYLEVSFRIKLNYKNILINRSCLAVGYVAGLLLFIKTLYWEWIFLGGQLGSLLFLLKNTQLLKEPLIKTNLFKSISIDCGALLCASLLGNAMNYADKLLLYPMIGGTGVAVYYAATLIGKMISIAISPVTSVILSYIAHFNSIKTQIIVKILGIGAIVCFLGYIATIIMTKPVLLLLYPQWSSEAMKLVPVTTIATVIGAMCSLINPFTLKFCSRLWQIFINAASLIIYVAASMLLTKPFGIVGFCWGTVIGCVVKFIIMIFVYFRVNREKENGEMA